MSAFGQTGQLSRHRRMTEYDPKLSLSQSAKDHISFDRDLAHNVASRLEASTRGRRRPKSKVLADRVSFE
jgi:hypothetical protein